MKKLLSLILVAVMLVTAMPMAFAEGETYKVGDIIQFGSYPQSEVKDENLIAELNALAPSWDDWTSYGYYSGTGDYGTMVQGDWMRYNDITYNGNKYRAVKFTQYRPKLTNSQSLLSETYQDDNGYSVNIICWFKFEAIDWRVLDPTTGLVMCETIIDSQPYSNTIYYNSNISYKYDYFNDASYENYANDYETSSIREWLNNYFYNTAFTDYENKVIDTTTLNNDSIDESLDGKLDSNETKDKIFLLSYNEVCNSNYGFRLNASAKDPARSAKGSDYAQNQGLYVSSYDDSNSYWVLRTSHDDSEWCRCVSPDGSNSAMTCVQNASIGIRPALRLNNMNEIKHEHDYKAVISNPSCTTQGYTTYFCECGDTYVTDYVDATGHNFTDYISYSTATCVTDGKLIAKCDNCNEFDTILEKGTHKFSSTFTIDKNPTCTFAGEKSRHCFYCSEKIDILPIGKLAHQYEIIVTTSTCTAQGYTTYTCECGDTYVSYYIDAIGHTYTPYLTDPTCTDKGLKVNICSCGDSYTETIPATGHTFSGSVCTTCGYDKADTCSCNCHKSGLSALLWKLLNFFYKLLRINETCACGTAHY